MKKNNKSRLGEYNSAVTKVFLYRLDVFRSKKYNPKKSVEPFLSLVSL